MRRASLKIWLVALSIALAAGIGAQAWTPVVPGIDYQYFHLTSPRVNNVFVTRMDRATTSTIIDVSLANGKILQPGVGWNTETIPNQVARYNGAFGYWGRQTARYRYKVVAAVNGNGFSSTNGCPDSAVVMNGAFIKRTFGSTGTEQGGGMGFLYKQGSSAPTPGTPYMGGDLYLPSNQSKNRISFTDGTYLQFDKLNDKPSNGISIYTHHYGARTPTTLGALEVVVQNQDSAPLRILPWSNYVTGTAVSIKANSSGGTVIPFDGYVIVASGSSIADLEAKIPAVGTEVRFSQETRDTSGLDWTNLYCGIGPMWGVIVRDGVKSSSTSASFTTDIAPRTCVAFNAQYIYFIVIDGRDTGVSEGVTLSEMADWVMSEFNVTDAVNDDGGGSSTMWVDGQVKNNPSDGQPRQVADGLMMIQLQPKEVSRAFGNGWTVYVDKPAGSINLMTGPGNNFHVIQSISNGTALTIVPHGLNGLRAQDVNGQPGYWWCVKTASGQTGWVSEYYLYSLAYAKTWTLYQ